MDATFLQEAPNQSLASYLDALEETWNKRIDKDVEALGEGLGALVKELEVRSEALGEEGRSLTVPPPGCL